MDRKVAVTFEPSGDVVWVPRDTTVLEAARQAGVIVPAPCGGRGICGSCAVRVVSGVLAEADASEVQGLLRAPVGVRLACRARIETDVTIQPVVGQQGTRAVETEWTAPLVAAVDLGTTTVAAAAIDPQTGREIGRATVPNRQASWGADVLSRVSAVIGGHGRELQMAAEASVLEALTAACGDKLALIERCVVAGNTIMTALLAGADVSPMAGHPFTLPDIPSQLPESSEVLARLAPRADVLLMPPIAGFVGGDALAAVLSTGLGEGGTSLLVDVGTNAEIVLYRAGEFFVASAAAGPAFDGSGIACGGPAVPGAIQSVSLDGAAVAFDLIGGPGAAGWFSGAGLVSALATLRRLEVLSADGAFAESGALAERLSRDDSGVLGFSFARDQADSTGCVTLTQKDVRVLQLAKGAVRSGIEHVMRAADVTAEDLDEVLVAGAFGAALDVADIVEVGLIPAPAAARTRAVGNASLAGAVCAALSPEGIDRVAATMAMAQHVDLAADPGFMDTLMAAVSLSPYGG